MGPFLETLFGGLMVGMLYSLVALGLVLIFKASGVFNFAQGAMVLFAALAVARLAERMPLWAAILIAIAIMVALAYLIERLVLRPGRRSMVATGLAVAIPAGHAGFVQPRSGLAANHGIAVVNSPGLIDAGYRGELRVVLLNTDPERDFTIEVGDRIAQLVILALPAIELVEVEELPGSERAERGFGSSAVGPA